MDKYKTPESSRRLASVMLASGALGRPMIGPPGTPPERVRILREAFNKTMEDKDFLTDLEKRKFDLDHSSGEELEKIVKDALSQPPEIIGRMKKTPGRMRKAVNRSVGVPAHAAMRPDGGSEEHAPSLKLEPSPFLWKPRLRAACGSY
jgi:hypothetical protein